MPQLNPHPWFMIMLATWTITLFIMSPLLLKILIPNQPKPPMMNKSLLTWTWPWS